MSKTNMSNLNEEYWDKDRLIFTKLKEQGRSNGEALFNLIVLENDFSQDEILEKLNKGSV